MYSVQVLRSPVYQRKYIQLSASVSFCWAHRRTSLTICEHTTGAVYFPLQPPMLRDYDDDLGHEYRTLIRSPSPSPIQLKECSAHMGMINTPKRATGGSCPVEPHEILIRSALYNQIKQESQHPKSQEFGGRCKHPIISNGSTSNLTPRALTGPLLPPHCGRSIQHEDPKG